MQADPLPVRPDEVVLEVSELEESTPELLDRLRVLRREGYTIALDDFVIEGPCAGLLPVAHVVKLDVLSLGVDDAVQAAAELRHEGVSIVAEKVEDRRDFERLRDAGIPFFQGYFYERPVPMSSRRSPHRAIECIHTVSELLMAGDDLDRLHEIAAGDAVLTFRLLRLANSGFYGTTRRVETLREALVRIGVRSAREWLSMMLLHGLSDPRHPALLTAIARARLCADLAGEETSEQRDRCFLVGLLSTLDALLGPFPALLAEANVGQRVTDALLSRAGPEGTILAMAIELQRGTAPAGLDPGLSAQLAVGAERAAAATTMQLTRTPSQR